MYQTIWPKKVCQDSKFQCYRDLGSIIGYNYESLQWISIILHSINRHHIDCYCIRRILCCFPIPLFVFIYSRMCQLICKYEPKYESLILTWPFRPLSLFFLFMLVIMYFIYVVLFSPLKKKRPFLKQTWTPSPKDALCHFWLKLIHQL